jgi:hypothetical protein
MLFVDYVFHLLPDGSIQMDNELTAKSIQVKEGDKFTVTINDTGTIYFRKEHDTVHTRTD